MFGLGRYKRYDVKETRNQDCGLYYILFYITPTRYRYALVTIKRAINHALIPQIHPGNNQAIFQSRLRRIFVTKNNEIRKP